MSLGNENGDLVPFHGCWDPISSLTLVQDVAKGEVITRLMVATQNDSVLWQMRDEMDRMR